MTRFEKACESPSEMAVMVAFCILTYVNADEIRIPDEEYHKFMETTSEDVQRWLMQDARA